jgi:hypothetical protein
VLIFIGLFYNQKHFYFDKNDVWN